MRAIATVWPQRAAILRSALRVCLAFLGGILLMGDGWAGARAAGPSEVVEPGSWGEPTPAVATNEASDADVVLVPVEDLDAPIEDGAVAWFATGIEGSGEPSQAVPSPSMRLFIPFAQTGRSDLPALPTPDSTAPIGPLPSYRPTAVVPDGSMLHLSNPNELTSIVVDRAREIAWVGSHGGGLLRWDLRTGTHSRFTAPGDLPDNRVFALARDTQGHLWVGTAGGLRLLPAGETTFDRVDANGRELDGSVRSIAIGSDGTVAVGIDGGGVRLRAPDGTWDVLAGAHLALEGDRRDVVSVHDTGGGVPITVPVRGELAWFGNGCDDVLPGGTLAGKIGLAAPGAEQSSCDVVGRAMQAGLVGLVVGGPAHNWRSYQNDPRATFPIVSMADDEVGALRLAVLSGGRIVARLANDGAPEAIANPSSLAIDPRGDLWVGTFERGLLHRSAASGSWRIIRRDEPIEVIRPEGTTRIWAQESGLGPQQAVDGPAGGELAWMGTGCPGTPSIQDVAGRIALIRPLGQCQRSAYMQRAADAGAIAAIAVLESSGTTVELGYGIGHHAAIPLSYVRISQGLALISDLQAGRSVSVAYAPRLLSSAISALGVATNGDLWVGTDGFGIGDNIVHEGGVTILPFDGTAWKSHLFWQVNTLPVPADKVHGMAFDAADAWLATHGGLVHVDPFDRWSVVEPALASLRAVRVEGGDVWAATSSGLARRGAVSGTVDRWLADATLGSNWITRLAEDTTGAIWFGTGARIDVSPAFLSGRLYEPLAMSAGLTRFDRVTGQSILLSHDSTHGAVPSDQVHSLFADPVRPRVWAGTTDGIVRIDTDTGRLASVSQEDRVVVEVEGEPGDSFAARELSTTPSLGLLSAPLAWFGDGCNPSDAVEMVRDRVALIERSIASRRCDFRDQILAAQALGARAILVHVSDPDVSAMELYRSDVELRIGGMIVGTAAGRRLFDALRTGRPVSVTLATGTAPLDGREIITGIGVDGSGRTWMAYGAGGLLSWSDGRWTRHHRNNSSAVPSVYFATDLRVDRNDTIWLAGLAGVGRTSVALDRPPSPLPPISSLGNLGAWTIDVHQRGDVWVGTADAGVRRLLPDGSAWRAHTRASTNDGLPSDQVTASHVDATGTLWLGTGRGVATYDALRDRWRSVAVPLVTDVTTDRDGDVWLGTGGAGAVRLSRHEAGADCGTAEVLAPGAVISTTLSGQGDIDLYALRVEKPYSRIELTVADPGRQVDFFLRHSCVGISASGRHISASGRHISASGRHIGADQRLVFDVLADPGTYYVDIRPRIGSQPGPIGYRLRSGVSQVDLESRRTLILTDADAVRSAFGLAADSEEYVGWLDSLRALQADAGVAGLLITDLKAQTNEAVRAAYADWVTNEDVAATSAKANAVASALRAWIWERRGTDLPKLQYVVLAGDDRIVPHFRLEVEAPAEGGGWRRESGYLAGSGIDAESTVGTALADDAVLTDDGYGTPVDAGWEGAPGLAVPELAVGRLVERPGAMATVVEGYLRRGGATTVGAGLIAEREPMADAGDAVAGALAEAGAAPGAGGRVREPGWGAARLRAALGSRRDIIVAAVPGEHDAVELGDGTRMAAGDLVGAAGEVTGSLVVGLGSHGGLNVPGPGHARGADWPEAWLEGGATYIGQTGWAYGMEGGLQYGEKLLSEAVRLALQGDGRVIGDALVAAKQAYAADVAEESAYHAATLAGTVLYGLPMARLRVGTVVESGSGEVAGDGAEVWGADASAMAYAMPGREAEEPEEVAPGVWRVAVMQRVSGLERVEGAAGTHYAAAGGQPRLESGRTVQPTVRVALPELAVGASSVPARGVVWLGGTSRREASFRPWVPAAWASGVGAERPVGDESRDDAPRPVALWAWGLSDLVGEVLVGRREGRVQYTAGWYDRSAGAQWLAESIATEEYYGEGEDREPPEIGEVATSPDGGGVAVSARVDDASGLLRVVATWRAAGTGTWSSTEMAQAPDGAWRAALLASATDVLVQAVDRAGNAAAVR